MEIWKPVLGMKKHYEVSNLGGVRSLSRLVKCRGGKLRNHAGRALTPRPHKFGYPMVTMSIDGKSHHATVHRLIMEAFVGPRPAGAHICHANGDPAQSILSNLRYDTPAGNAADKLTHGTQLSGEEIYNAKLTNKIVEEMRVLRAAGEKLRNIAGDYGLSELAVHQITTGVKWKNAPGPITGVKRVVRRLSDAEKQDACDHLAAGVSQSEVARRLKVSVTQIVNIRKSAV